jgi:hypothetical protein
MSLLIIDGIILWLQKSCFVCSSASESAGSGRLGLRIQEGRSPTLSIRAIRGLSAAHPNVLR